MTTNVITKDQLMEPYTIISEAQFKDVKGIDPYYKRMREEIDKLESLSFDPNYQHLLDFSKALSNEIRIKMIYFIQSVGKTCFCELERVFQVKQSTLNYHVGLLKRANLVDAYKEGKLIVLQLSDNFHQILPKEQFGLFSSES